MTATITELPRRRLRHLAPIDIKIKALTWRWRSAGLASSSKGRSSGPTHTDYRCRCPLCDGPMRVAYEPCGDTIGIDCQRGCAPEAVVTDLIKRGLFTCRDARDWPDPVFGFPPSPHI